MIYYKKSKLAILVTMSLMCVEMIMKLSGAFKTELEQMNFSMFLVVVSGIAMLIVFKEKKGTRFHFNQYDVFIILGIVFFYCIKFFGNGFSEQLLLFYIVFVVFLILGILLLIKPSATIESEE